MKFKVDPKSELYEKLMEFDKKYQTTYNEIKTYVKNIGGEAFSLNNAFHVIGRVNGIQFTENPDKTLWRSVGPKYMNLYMPKSKNKAVLTALEELPYLEKDEYNNIFGNPSDVLVENQGGLGLFNAPGCKFLGKEIVLKVPSSISDYKPIPGMIEILESEYNRLILEHTNEPKN